MLANPAGPVPPADLAAASTVPLRRLFHPVILLPAALLIAAGAALGFVADRTSSTSAGAAASATTPDDGYVQAYAGYAFTMPGGGCTAAVNPSDVVLASPQPYVDTKSSDNLAWTATAWYSNHSAS
jgi:hypothetical protein